MPCPRPGDLEEQTHLRFLVSNYAAGVMFALLEGFSGKTIPEDFDYESITDAFEFEYEGARIQVSHIHQVFPGTTDRILMFSGPFVDIVNALDVVLIFFGEELRYNPPLNLIVPELSFQVFTRPGGITIRSMYEECKTTISLLRPNHHDVCSDRLVRVFGSDSQCYAISLILAKLAEDPFYLPPLESPYTYAGDLKKQTHIRLLVSNTAAEFIIEKHGSKSNEFVFMLSDAQIQLSRNDETFPGTSDRILMVSGTFNNITMAVELLFSSLRRENHCSTKINVVVPNRFCDAMTAGVTIKSITEKSMTEINISPPSFSCDVLDSLVTVSGTGSGFHFRQMRAIYLILSKLTEDACYPPPLESPYTYADIPLRGDLVGPRTPCVHYEATICRFGGMEENYIVRKDKAPQVDCATSGFSDECDDLMTINIPSAHVGGINDHDAKNSGNVPQGKVPRLSVRWCTALNNDRLRHLMFIAIPAELLKDVRGHHGRSLKKARQVSGATIKIVNHDKSDHKGQSERGVMISGPVKAIQNAKNIIVKKLEQKLRGDGMLLECSEYGSEGSSTCC